MVDVFALGPINAADELITESEYTIADLPVLYNDKLQRAGKPPMYFLAAKHGASGTQER